MSWTRTAKFDEVFAAMNETCDPAERFRKKHKLQITILIMKKDMYISRNMKRRAYLEIASYFPKPTSNYIMNKKYIFIDEYLPRKAGGESLINLDKRFQLAACPSSALLTHCLVQHCSLIVLDDIRFGGIVMRVLWAQRHWFQPALGKRSAGLVVRDDAYVSSG